MFQERVRPKDRYWWQSSPGHVLAGDVVEGSIELSGQHCNLTLRNVQAGTTKANSLVLDTATFGNPQVFFVMEHAPHSCGELPQKSVVFSHFNVGTGTEPVVDPSALRWTVQQPSDNPCGIYITPQHSGQALQFSWRRLLGPGAGEDQAKPAWASLLDVRQAEAKREEDKR